MKRDIRHQPTYATISSSVLKSKSLVGLFHILGFTIEVCLKVMEFSGYMISYVFCNLNIVIRYLKSSSDLFVSKNRLKLLKLTRNSFMLSMLDFILFVTGLYPIFFFFLVCVHDTRTYTFLNMLIWTSTLYHQETGFTTFLHKSSFITFILKTSFTPILYVSTLAFKNTKV